jgi:hypothetical protein
MRKGGLLMAVTNKRKQEVCELYSTYLQLIYHLGNKVMLMKQLFEYAKIMGLARHYPHFHSQIKELVEADILRQEPFVAFNKVTQLHMLTLKKYAIRFIEGKEKSHEVSAVAKANNNERILLSIFKNTYILDKIIPRLIKQGVEVSFSNIVAILNQDNSNILYNKNKALDYLNELLDSPLKQYFNMDEMNYVIHGLVQLKNKKMEALKRGAETREGKGKGKISSQSKNAILGVYERYTAIQEMENSQLIQSVKDRKIANYNIDSMFNAYCYIVQIKPINNTLMITVLLFDLNNKQDIYKFATHIACIYHMFNRYLNTNFKLKVGIIALDEEAQKNIEADAKRGVKDIWTKEIKGERLPNILRSWGVDEVMQQNIDIRFTNYNITNRYLEGVKYANLLRR